jgi:hypothetical protein
MNHRSQTARLSLEAAVESARLGAAAKKVAVGFGALNPASDAKVIVEMRPVNGMKVEVGFDAHLCQLIENILPPAVVLENLVLTDEAGPDRLPSLEDFHRITGPAQGNGGRQSGRSGACND